MSFTRPTKTSSLTRILRCQRCGQIVEEGILVSEVGFAESAGGRVHVQGTFVSNYATGVAGSRGGRGGQQNIENIKAQGRFFLHLEQSYVNLIQAHQELKLFRDKCILVRLSLVALYDSSH